MQDRTGTDSDAHGQPIAVSPDNPCPFLRASVAEGYVSGHNVPLGTLAQTVQAASGKTGFAKMKAGIETRLVALVANGLSPFRLIRSWWSGATLDELPNGPLDKHGVPASSTPTPTSTKTRSSASLPSARIGRIRWAAVWSAASTPAKSSPT